MISSALPRQSSRDGLKSSFLETAHAVYVVGRNAKDRVRQVVVPRRAVAETAYPKDELDDDSHARPHSWPRLTPRAAATTSSDTAPRALRRPSSSLRTTEAASPRTPVSTYDVKKFVRGFPDASLSSETLHAAYPCALEREGGLWHGKMFLTTRRLRFVGSQFLKTIRVVIEYRDIEGIEKTSSGGIISNGLRLYERGSDGQSRQETLFTAFVGRDAASADLEELRWRERRHVAFVQEPVESTEDLFTDEMSSYSPSTLEHDTENAEELVIATEADPLLATPDVAPTSPSSARSGACGAISLLTSTLLDSPSTSCTSATAPTPHTNKIKYARGRTTERKVFVVALLSLAVVLLISVITAALNVARIAAVAGRLDRVAT